MFSINMIYKSMSLTVDNTFVDYLINANSEAFGYIVAAYIYINRPVNGAKRTIIISLILVALLSLILIGFYDHSVAV